MTVNDMKERKKELGYTHEQLAVRSGLPIDTIYRIFGSDQTTKNRISDEKNHSDFDSDNSSGILDYETWIALEQALGKWSHSMASETASAYAVRRQGEYTLEDYYNIPDEYRCELIDGVIYDMGAPTSIHQAIAASMFAQLHMHVRGKKGACFPMISPLDVQLDCDDKTMVQPDVVIICDRSKIIRRCVYGAPDFIAEVLSPSSRRKDMIIKLNKYMHAHVREYWLIDPMKKTITVYDFEHDEYPVIYGFDAKIPVRIWNGEFKVDFAEIYEETAFLYENDLIETD